ncbi:MAG: ABC transporter substrate-binding protein [Pirellulales bacterium]
MKLLACSLILCWLLAAGVQSVLSQEPPVRLLERPPFDRITLDAANQGVVIDVLPLDLPGRRIPQPLPTQGALKLRRMVDPSLEYSVSWESIARIELYEQLLLADVVELLKVEEMGAAFEVLSLLHKNYPSLPGLQETTDRYLYRDATREFQGGRYEEALAILLSLHDRNPKYADLGKAVEAVADRLIRKQLGEKRYYAARMVLVLLEQAYTEIRLPSVSIWKQRFRQASQRQLKIARDSLDKKQYGAARAALHQATDIFPDLSGINTLIDRLSREHPEIVVGVARLSPPRHSLPRWGELVQTEQPGDTLLLSKGSLLSTGSMPESPRQNASESLTDRPLADWAAIRVAPLVNPPLIERVGFESEGGVYRCPWAKLVMDESGLIFSLHLTPAALRLGARADGFARSLLTLADPNSSNFLEDFAIRFRDLSLSEGRSVVIRWHSVPVRPEALLRCSARAVPSLEKSLTFYQREKNQEPGEVRFRRQGSHLLHREDQQGLAEKAVAEKRLAQEPGPLTIVERQFREDEAAVQALIQGEVDLLDRVPPWQLEKLESHDQIIVGTYRLPTIHVLRLHPRNQLLDQREFRRALCYGINREMLIQDILLAGQAISGFQAISGPFPVGKSRHDPVGYAYNQQLAVRPYEPRLAAVLAEVARVAIIKPSAADSQQELPAKPESEEALTQETRPLVLRYPPEPVARAACQSMKIQLERIGIPIELSESIEPGQLEKEQMATNAGVNTDPESSVTADYDLLYTELAMWEPVVDARRLLGPAGVAGRCSPSMGLALDRLDRAQNWKQVQASLQQVHRVAHYDLPVIPLWQTYSNFAHRKTLLGFGEKPIAVYQQVAQWRKE